MQKTNTHFEQVPLEVVEKLLDLKDATASDEQFPDSNATELEKIAIRRNRA